MPGTTVVLGHLDELAFCIFQQLGHIAGVGATKLEDVLVVIAYGNHAHLLVGCHEGSHQGIFLLTHVLSLVNHQNCLGYAVWFHLSISNHLCCTRHNVLGIIEISYPAKQVEAIGMECLDFHKVGSIANESHKSLLEFYRRRSREGEHQQLFVLHILKQEQRCQFVYQYAGLATSRTCCHHYAS